MRRKVILTWGLVALNKANSSGSLLLSAKRMHCSRTLTMLSQVLVMDLGLRFDIRLGLRFTLQDLVVRLGLGSDLQPLIDLDTG